MHTVYLSVLTILASCIYELSRLYSFLEVTDKYLVLFRLLASLCATDHDVIFGFERTFYIRDVTVLKILVDIDTAFQASTNALKRLINN